MIQSKTTSSLFTSTPGHIGQLSKRSITAISRGATNCIYGHTFNLLYRNWLANKLTDIPGEKGYPESSCDLAALQRGSLSSGSCCLLGTRQRLPRTLPKIETALTNSENLFPFLFFYLFYILISLFFSLYCYSFSIIEDSDYFLFILFSGRNKLKRN